MPEPWDAQQVSDEEILYINRVTGQTTTEHPLDDYYRRLYREKRMQRAQRLGTAPEKRFQPEMAEAKEDPLLRKEFEKKVKAYKEKMEKEFQQKCAEIDASVEKEKGELTRQLEEKKKELKRKQEASLKNEKAK